MESWKRLIWAATIGLGACPVKAGESVLPSPALPSATVPPEVSLPLPLPVQASASEAEPGKTGGTGVVRGTAAKKRVKIPPKITLGKTSQSITPFRHGAGTVNAGDIKVKAQENRLKATLSGAAYAHCYIGCHAEGALELQLVQEFDLVPSVRDDPRVSLTLSAKLEGYLRSESPGNAQLSLAEAAIYPAGGGGPVMTLGFEPWGGTTRVSMTAEYPRQTVSAGRYVLVANFTPSASVDGVFHGHAEAVFTPGPRAGTWDFPANPFADLDDAAFGLVIDVKAGVP